MNTSAPDGFAIDLCWDGSPEAFSQHLCEIDVLFKQLPEVPFHVVDLFLGFLKSGPKLACVNRDIGAASRASFIDVSISREALDFLADLVSALRARDFNDFILKHDVSSMGGCDASTLAEMGLGVESSPADKTDGAA